MAKNIVKVLFSNFFIACLGIITSFVFPKIMSVESYSEYQEFYLYLSYLGICQLGLATGMVINYAGKSQMEVEKSLFKSELVLQIIILMIFSCIFALGYMFCGGQSLLYLVIIVLPYCYVESYKSLFQAWSEFTKYSIINTAIPLLRVFFSLMCYFILQTLTGQFVIYITIICYYSIFFYVLRDGFLGLKNIKTARLFTRHNTNTLWLGLRIMLGNYLDILFKTFDKLFIIILFSTYDFAMYSFALSMHNIVNIFIVSIAQPMFPYMASHELTRREMKNFQNLLIIFGALSGLAYFGCSFIVDLFLDKYTDSKVIMLAYFAAFPALYVINCLYINLYKINKDTKGYIVSLVILLLSSFALNYVSIKAFNTILAVAIATTVVYYGWLIFGAFHFENVNISVKDIAYIACYLLTYIICSCIGNDVIAGAVYISVICILSFAFYRKSLELFIMVPRI